MSFDICVVFYFVVIFIGTIYKQYTFYFNISASYMTSTLLMLETLTRTHVHTYTHRHVHKYRRILTFSFTFFVLALSFFLPTISHFYTRFSQAADYLKTGISLNMQQNIKNIIQIDNFLSIEILVLGEMYLDGVSLEQ